MANVSIEKITTVLAVEVVQPSLDFWQGRLGFECTVTVPHGDTIGFASEVAEKRVTLNRPGWGIIFARNTGTNQKGELVMSFIGSGFVERRPGAA